MIVPFQALSLDGAAAAAAAAAVAAVAAVVDHSHSSDAGPAEA